MAAIPVGFHRVNFNCSQDLFKQFQARLREQDMRMSVALTQLMKDYLLVDPPGVTHPDELPEELKIVAGTQIATPPEPEEEVVSSRLL